MLWGCTEKVYVVGLYNVGVFDYLPGRDPALDPARGVRLPNESVVRFGNPIGHGVCEI